MSLLLRGNQEPPGRRPPSPPPQPPLARRGPRDPGSLPSGRCGPALPRLRGGTARRTPPPMVQSRRPSSPSPEWFTPSPRSFPPLSPPRRTRARWFSPAAAPAGAGTAATRKCFGNTSGVRGLPAVQPVRPARPGYVSVGAFSSRECSATGTGRDGGGGAGRLLGPAWAKGGGGGAAGLWAGVARSGRFPRRGRLAAPEGNCPAGVFNFVPINVLVY